MDPDGIRNFLSQPAEELGILSDGVLIEMLPCFSSGVIWLFFFHPDKYIRASGVKTEKIRDLFYHFQIFRSK